MEQQEITIYNHDATNDLTFNISHKPSLTATGYSLAKNQSFTPDEPIGLYAGNQSSVATVSFDKTSLVIPAGEAAKVRVHIEPPSKTFTLENHVLYGGYIMISTSSNEASVEA